MDDTSSQVEKQDTKVTDQKDAGPDSTSQEEIKNTIESSVPVRETEKNDGPSHPNPNVPKAKEPEEKDKIALPVQDPKSLNGEIAYSWLKDLSKRMYSVEDDVKKTKDGSKKSKEEAAGAPHTYMSQTIPEVRDCNWEQFKNRFPDEKGVCTIEVLLSSKNLDEEIEMEQLKRLTPEKKLEVLRTRAKTKIFQQKGSGPRRLERVRINSAFILASLAKITGEKWADKPHTFLKPFKTFVHHHRKMEEELQQMEAKMDTMSHETPAAGNPDSNDKEGHASSIAVEKTTVAGQIPGETDHANPSGGLVDAKERPQHDIPVPVKAPAQKAYEDMKCYIDFVKTELLPVYTMYDNVDSSKPTKVRYHDLWSVFRSGELAIQRPIDKSDNDRDESKFDGSQQGTKGAHTATAEPMLGRVFWIKHTNPDPDWEVDDLAETGTGGRLHRDRNADEPELATTTVGFYYIDHDGDEYGSVHKYFALNQFNGQKDVTSLPVYPLRFSKNQDRILRDLRARGEKFQTIMDRPTLSNLSYQGWTLTRTPLGGSIEEEEEGVSNRSPSYIDSDVIVDFHEAYQSRPWWKPNFVTLERHTYTPQTSDDRFPITRWASRDRKLTIRKDSEVVVHDDVVCSLELNQLLDSIEGKFLLAPEDKSITQTVAAKKLSGDDFALLPPRLFAYALRERKFVNANIRYMKMRPTGANSFGKLRISDQHKSLVQSVVFEHFQKKEAQKQGIALDLEISDQDFIRGKGRGLVILLHGAPGVGKTATAEAVSLAYDKPLFPITCGNLGTEPETVEEVLTELFRLANLWDCILLLDEAEIFLSPREKRDDNLQRNALVSVFLRILEYYSGILFLTTNRSGALDEAVKSRVHLSLLYPHLGYRDTVSLFKMNIDRLAQIEQETARITGQKEMTIEENGVMDFAERHYRNFEGMEDSRWNGRQIRNAFQIAASLARYQHHQQPHRGLYVGAEHFEKVEDATLEYDKFRNSTANKTESEIAYAKGDRGPDIPPSDRRSLQQHSPGHQSQYNRAPSPRLQRSWHSSSMVPPEARTAGGSRSSQRDLGGSAQSSPFDGSSGFGTPTNRQG
ncbi:hypothetical protein Daus18300_011241 [Diaporthe australafricana]|uniref:AAA+ ATPase domain-containing protein n=1 Tax=Diaporthe australafricana TaxID=127596 RepID=A0ABR3W7B1_9PEZI